MLETCRRTARRLPVNPDKFDVEIGATTVTNGADHRMLRSKYRKTCLRVWLPATCFELSDIPKEDAASWGNFLDTILVLCTNLRKVDLSLNETIIATLGPFVGLTSLEELALTICAGLQGSLKPLSSLSNLRSLSIAGCVKLQGDLVPLSGL